jgi:hypothetical protein
MRPGIIALALLLSACGSIGNLKDDEYTWQEEVIPSSYQQAFRNIRAGFQRCPVDASEGHLYEDTKTAEFDVFLTGMFGERGPFVKGRIFITSIGPTESRVRVGVLSTYDGPGLLGLSEPGWTRKQWLRWASGDSRCRKTDSAQ